MQPTRDNTAIVFLDLQRGILGNSRTVHAKRVKRASGLLAQLAALHGLPTFLSAVPPGGKFIDDVLKPLGKPKPSPRTQTTAFADTSLVAAIAASGRKTLVLAGCASEVVVQRTALDAIAAGYDVYVAVDACGGADERTEKAAWRRIVAAGGTTSSVATVIAELAGDFTTDLGARSLALMQRAMAL